MSKTIPASKVGAGDILIDAETGAECKVEQTNEDEIAWSIPCDTGGAFGYCFRERAPSIFSNVTKG